MSVALAAIQVGDSVQQGLDNLFAFIPRLAAEPAGPGTGARRSL